MPSSYKSWVFTPTWSPLPTNSPFHQAYFYSNIFNMSKTVAFATVLLAASGFVDACTQVRGTGDSGLGGGIQMWLTSNGVDVCYVKKTGDNMSGSMTCNAGYSANFQWGAITGGVNIQYVGPGGPLNFNAVTDCDNWNCCGGE
ncbi:hypothetical protein DL96DRAFT_1676591, partial [Flagelloscypha sp. PMI_526]